MAGGHGRTHFKDQLLAVTSRTGTLAKLWSKPAIFEEFRQASASIRFNKSFLLVTPVT